MFVKISLFQNFVSLLSSYFFPHLLNFSRRLFRQFELLFPAISLFNCYRTEFEAIVVKVCLVLRLEEEYWYSKDFFN